MEAWLIILVSLSACFFIKLLSSLLFSSKKNESKGHLFPPGPPPLPIIGHLHLLPKSTIELRSLLSNLSQKYGPVLTLLVGSKPLVFITSYPIAHKALVKNSAIFANRPPVVPVSYVLSNKHKDIGGSPYGVTWRVLRRNLVSEALHPAGLKSYSFARKRSMETMINSFEQQSSKQEGEAGAVRLFEHLHQAVFSLFILMTYGDIGEDAIREVEHIQYTFLVSYAKFSVFANWPRLGKLVYRKRWQKYTEFLRRQYDILMPHIRARQKLKQEKKAGKEVVNLVTYTDTLLDLEISEGAGKLEEADVLSLSSEFINAGADTTATMFQWVMAYLVKYPRVQAKLFAEISRVVEQGAEEVKEEDLQRIPYLKAVILECLRIHPPNTSLVPHTNTEDMEISGYNIPKNTTVLIGTAIIGRDPTVWENPMEFRPERMMTSTSNDNGTGGEEVGDVTSFKMLPFGAGRRMCPGYKYGSLIIEYFVANLVWNFEWKAVDDVDLSEKEEFLVVMKNPVRAQVIPRRVK
ncbi:cytochrome P450 89A2-like [Alnus glutinosa]|uniref:cytochrome P450 89A2-like n=1 Tax=Alnus glutinosa TaxID=3517 RepID=UPI002D77B672|nr:cytochrome P450 89A2-like [Alnus glutinosa]